MTKTELLKIAKPILFNTEMVRAILDGRKNVTRRLVKPQPPRDAQYPLGYCVDGDKKDIGKFAFGMHESGGKMVFCKPPCQTGDILYVRETWTLEEYYDDEALIRFKAGGNIGIDYECEGDTYSKLLKYADKKWNPSLFMPKEATRILLRVKNVRVERLQDMRSEDALNEGIKVSKFDLPHTGVLNQFKKLWNSTIKKSELARYGWEANPWVWVIEFERIEPKN